MCVARSARPAWASLLDVVSDVLLGVGLAVGALLAVGAGLVLAIGEPSGLAAWVVGTGERLAGPLVGWVASPDPVQGLALGLALGAVAWGIAGWGLSRLLRPG